LARLPNQHGFFSKLAPLTADASGKKVGNFGGNNFHQGDYVEITLSFMAFNSSKDAIGMTLWIDELVLIAKAANVIKLAEEPTQKEFISPRKKSKYF
jgi:hypothetical protein